MGDSVLNKATVKRMTLGMADAKWHGAYGTRVSAEWYTWLEDVVRSKIVGGIHTSPSKGRTLYPPIRTKETTGED